MKTTSAIVSLGTALVVMATPAFSQTFPLDVKAGKDALTATNFSAAAKNFAAALALTPHDPEANVLYAFSVVASLPNSTGGAAFLNSLGVTTSGRDVYHWKAGFAGKNPKGNADALTTLLTKTVVPGLNAAQSSLANIVDTTATVNLTTDETHRSSVTVDWGDVQVARAIASGWACFLGQIDSWNLNASIPGIQATIKKGGTLESLLQANPKAFTYASVAGLPASRSALTNAIACYLAGSEFIRNRPTGVRRLFNLDPGRVHEESQFRTLLSDLEQALNGPVTLTGNPGYAINLQPLFDGKHSFRSFLPKISGDEFVWGTVDSTFGGIVSGVSEDAAGLTIAKHFKLKAKLENPGLTVTKVKSLSNAYQATALAAADGSVYVVSPYGGTFYNGVIYRLTATGTLRTIHIFGDANGDPGDGVNPSPLMQASDGMLYGTTAYSTNGSGTLFSVSPSGSFRTIGASPNQSLSTALTLGPDGNLYGMDGYSVFSVAPDGSSAQTLYSFNNGGYGMNASQGPLVLGADGLLYGTTLSGGNSGFGSIFTIDPNGNFQTIYSFANSVDGVGPVGLSVDTAGDLYGATSGQSQYSDQYGNFYNYQVGNGGVFKITPTGLTALYSFTNGLDGSAPSDAPLIIGGQALLGATTSGSPNREGVLYSLRLSGGLVLLVWGDKEVGTPSSPTPARDGSVYFLGNANNGNPALYHMTFAGLKIITQPRSVAAFAGTMITLSVKSTGSAFQWFQNNQPLSDTAGISGSATEELTLGPLTANNAGSYTCLVSGLYTSISSAAAIVTLKPDTSLPVVKILSTAHGIVSGIATDNAYVTNVNYWLTNLNVNSVAQGSAVLGSGSVSRAWSFSVLASPGTNVAAVQAADFSGNLSRIVTAKFFVPDLATITIAKAGAPANGTLTGPTNGQTLNVGQNYTLVAKPNPQSWFLNWTGSFPGGTSNNATLHFKMEEGMMITANFTSNLFENMAGHYTGLFAEDSIRAESSGMLGGFNLGNNGAFSGKLLLGGAAYPFAGKFPAAADGSVTVTAKSGSAKLVITNLSLGFNNSPRDVSGTVMPASGAWQASLLGMMDAGASQSFPGRYTALLLPGLDAAPPGDGFLLLTNNRNTFTLSGQLADGTAISQVTPITEGGALPVSLVPYKHGGLLYGWLSFDSAVNGTMEPTNYNDTPLVWIKKPALGGLYTAGFTNMLSVEGSTWTNGSPTTFAPGTLTLSLSQGGLTANEDFSVQFQASGSIMNLSAGTLTGSIGLRPPSPGKLTLQVSSPSPALKAYGAFLQSQQLGGGYFLGPIEGGTFLLKY